MKAFERMEKREERRKEALARLGKDAPESPELDLNTTYTPVPATVTKVRPFTVYSLVDNKIKTMFSHVASRC